MSRHHEQLKGHRWERTRRRIFQRDHYRCVLCGRAGRLECDHIVSLANGGDPWDPTNLRALCRSCNIKRARDERILALSTPGQKEWRQLIETMVSE